MSELSRMSGVSKGVISKIENSETKRPEFKTILSLAKALHIPFEQIIEYYIIVEQRPDVLKEILMESIQLSNMPLACKVALHFLQTHYEDSETLMEKLHRFVGDLSDNNSKLPLYEVIIKYARERGMQRFYAKGLLQKFLIEMQDLKRLEESFRLGEEVLHYVDFLNQEERIHFYYQMAFQAHDLKKYEKCIELGKMGHAEDLTSNEMKERVAWAICNSYYRMDDIVGLEEHLKMYEVLEYQFVIERLKYYRAIILSRNGLFDEAIPLLKECVQEASKNNRLHRVNILLEILILIKDIDAVLKIFKQEEKNFAFDFTTPYNFTELGKYYKHKGVFLVSNDCFDEGIEAYLQSMTYFSKINAREEIMLCSEEIYTLHIKKRKEIKLDLLERLKNVYNNVNTRKERE
ncbi:helix-turn-helix domain-containing protein [Brevibacillus sp. SYSU BS000544]|uniref:helix-turn-helix domain-containing protein n=1 Tax=Brevibacillus sp. SYSU BS000544 TaxID=3416443 RepID=UPI003CE49A7A